jgi:hypothetical protein
MHAGEIKRFERDELVRNRIVKVAINTRTVLSLLLQIAAPKAESNFANL